MALGKNTTEVMWTPVTWWRWPMLDSPIQSYYFSLSVYESQSHSSPAHTLGKRWVQQYLLGGEPSKDLWVHVHVKTTRAINKYFGGDTLRLCNYSIFSINFCSFVFAFTGGSCLQQLLLWCSRGSLLFFLVLIEVLLYRRAFPFFLFRQSFI